MKVRLDRAALADAATWVGLAVSKRPSSPALAGLRITAGGDEVTLHGFDYEVSHSATLAAEVMAEGEVLVSATLLRQIVGSMKGKTVELVLDGGQRLAIGAGRSAYRVGVMRLDEYPALPALPKRVGTVERDDLAELVARTEHAVGRDTSFSDITVLHLTTADGLLEAAATDRFRIAYASTPWDGSDFTADVPVAALGPALKGLSGTLIVGHEGGLLGLSDGRRSVTTRLAEVSFPKVASFLNTPGDTTVEVDAAELAEACKRAAMVAEEHAPILLHVTQGEITVSADSESGEGSEVVEAETPLDVDISLAFKAAFLSDALLASGATRVEMRLSSPTTTRTAPPTPIRPLGDDSAVFVVMPRRSTK